MFNNTLRLTCCQLTDIVCVTVFFKNVLTYCIVLYSKLTVSNDDLDVNCVIYTTRSAYLQVHLVGSFCWYQHRTVLARAP